MKKLALLLLPGMLFLSCEKHTLVPPTYEYSLMSMDFWAGDLAHAGDSSGNHISFMEFYNVGVVGDQLGRFMGISRFREEKPSVIKYAMKFQYVPDLPLVGKCTGGGSDSAGSWYRYAANEALIGKQLFAAVDTLGHLLSYKLYVDPYASIELRYTGDDIDPTVLAAAYNRYLLDMKKGSRPYFNNDQQ